MEENSRGEREGDDGRGLGVFPIPWLPCQGQPVAAGQLGVRPALIAAEVLVALSWSLTSFLDESLVGPAAGYFVFTVAYNIWLKRLLLVDVIAIAAGFALRVVGGAAARRCGAVALADPVRLVAGALPSLGQEEAETVWLSSPFQ